MFMKLIIQGGTPLRGRVRVAGAKNSSLVLIAASAISGEEVYLDNVPRIADVKTQMEIVRALGGQVSWPALLHRVKLKSAVLN